MTGRRPRLQATRGEDGYAMIVTVTIILIMTMLLVVVLAQAQHNNTISSRGARRAAALGVAEGGVSWAIAALQADRTNAVVTNRPVPVADGTGGNGTATVTVETGTPASPGKLGYYTIESTGRVSTANSPTRTLQVVLGPPTSFTYAVFGRQSLRFENNTCIVGTVYAKGDITFDMNSTVAGTSRARGSLISETGRIANFNGGNNAKCPATVDGEAVDSSNDIHGDVLAGGGTLSPCLPAPAGPVSAAAQGFNLNNATVGGQVCNNPTPTPMPEYTFNPANYASVQFHGRPPGYGAASLTAVTTGNAALAAANTLGGLSGAYVIWQDLSAYQAAGTTPPAVSLDLGTIRIAADTVIYTNVPVDFGNTTRVEAATACSTQTPPPSGTPACPLFQVISAYPGTPCGGGSCPAIQGGNKIEFRPEVAVLLYSRDGTIELRNDCNSADCNQSNQGSYYGNNVDAKNSLNVSYTPRIANALGFGRTQLQQVSWQEVAPCPAGQTPPVEQRRPSARPASRLRPMSPGTAALLAGLAGLLAGSFANVVIHRVPRRASLVRPGSHCPACQEPISWRDNLPLLSWLLLRGRCRHCRAGISVRYPAVELAMAVLWALVTFRLAGAGLAWAVPAYLAFAFVCVVLAVIDATARLLPNRITYPAFPSIALLLLVASLGVGDLGRLTRALVAAAAVGGLFLALALISPRGMGLGDVKLAPTLGLALGWLSWPAVAVGLFSAFMLGGVAGLGAMAVLRLSRKALLPFGPWLVAGALLGVLAGSDVARWYGSTLLGI